MPIRNTPTPVGSTPAVTPVAVAGQSGWLHLSADAPRRRAGFVIIAPPGRDGRCVHRPLRTLAQSLAAEGFPVLRIEPLGVGDSLDIDETAAAWTVWRHGAEAARDHLKTLASLDRIVLVGLRLTGRLIAEIDADGAVLLAPVASGKTWLRELKLAAAMSGTAGPDGDQALESEGLQLSAAAARSLQPVDLTSLAKHTAHALVFAQNAQAESVAKRLGELDVETRVEAFPGYEDLLDDSHSNKAPHIVFDTILSWADTIYPETRHSTPIQIAASGGRLGDGFEETPVNLGEGSTALVTRPAKPTGPGVIVCNTSGEPRAGIGRFAVSTARALAKEGVTTLRFDFLGIGDSETDGVGHMYEADRNPEFARAADYLCALGCSTITVLGVCSGSFHAIRALSALPSLDQAYCVSSRLVWRTGDSLDPQFRDQGKATVSYVTGIRDPETWMRLVRGDIDVLAVGRTLWGRFLGKVKARLNTQISAPLRTGIASISARGGALRLVMGLEDAALDELESYFGPGAKKFIRLDGMSMRVIDDLDHGLAKAASRAVVLEDFRAFLKLT